MRNHITRIAIKILTSCNFLETYRCVEHCVELVFAELVVRVGISEIEGLVKLSFLQLDLFLAV